MNSTICAIILAAGTSSRMGKTKQTLPFGERVLLEHVIQSVLAEEFAEIITVIGHKAETIKEKISIDSERFRWVENMDYLSGQSSSLKKGVESLGEHHSHIMVFLGDLPFTSSNTIHSIYQSGSERMKMNDEPFVIRPHYKGVSGHPVFFGNINRDVFAQLEGEKGGKTIMHQITNYILQEVEDKGILFDVDTPAQYSEAKRIIET